MQRNCPHCKTSMHVFDEECPACHKPSKPGAFLTIAGIVHGWRKVILLALMLAVAWIIMERLFG